MGAEKSRCSYPDVDSGSLRKIDWSGRTRLIEAGWARKKLGWTAVVERLKPDFPRIIPGNWGKAGSGWLAQPLGGRIARFGRGGRIHQFL
jgi:hypothetical protein